MVHQTCSFWAWHGGHVLNLNTFWTSVICFCYGFPQPESIYHPMICSRKMVFELRGMLVQTSCLGIQLIHWFQVHLHQWHALCHLRILVSSHAQRLGFLSCQQFFGKMAAFWGSFKRLLVGCYCFTLRGYDITDVFVWCSTAVIGPCCCTLLNVSLNSPRKKTGWPWRKVT